MRKFHFLALVVILPLVIAVPPMRVSATKSGGRQSNYAPGEVIVKLKAGAPQLRTAGQDERLMTIARLAGERSAGAPAEQLARTTSNQRISQIITDRGLDRIFVLTLDPGADIREMVSELRTRDDVK